MFASLPEEAKTCFVGLFIIACIIIFKEIVMRYQDKKNKRKKRRK